MDASEAERLFAQTLDGDYESEKAWHAVAALRQNGTREIFEKAAAWCLSDNFLKRARAAAVLCQMRSARPADEPPNEPHWIFRDESYLLIAKMLEDETDVCALCSEISALGHLGRATAAALILRHLDHSESDVRFSVTFALGSFPDDAIAVRGLLKLTSDEDAEVRDWAVFGLGVLGDSDSPEIREALLRCLSDPCQDVQEEAAVGLGKRQDRRLLPRLQAMLDESAPKVQVRVKEAADALLGLDGKFDNLDAAAYKAALKMKFNV